MKPAHRLLTAFGLALACAAPGSLALAQDPPPAAASPEAEGVSQIVTAAELAAWGRQRRDAEALEVAARMLDEVPLRAGAGGDPGVAPVLTAAGLRQEAAALRDGQIEIEEIVVTGVGLVRASRRTRAPVTSISSISIWPSRRAAAS